MLLMNITAVAATFMLLSRTNIVLLQAGLLNQLAQKNNKLNKILLQKCLLQPNANSLDNRIELGASCNKRMILAPSTAVLLQKHFGTPLCSGSGFCYSKFIAIV